MRIEGGSLRCTAELAMQVAGEGSAAAASAMTAPAAASTGALRALDAASNGTIARTAPAGASVATWLVPSGPGEIQRPAIGYAPAQVPSTRAAASAPAAKEATVSSPLDFLRDSRLTAEEKLVLLLAQQQKDVDKEIDTVLKKAEARSAQKTSGGGVMSRLKVLDVVKSAVPALAMVDHALGEGTLSKAVAQLGGPVLAAAATAFGAPQLAPLAMSYGSDLLGSALDAELPFGAGATAEPRAVNAPSAGAGSSTALDPVETQKLMLLVNRQQQWASTVSNLLHGLHQTRMGVIQNLR